MKIGTRTWQTLFGVAAAVVGVLLAQDLHPDVVIPPIGVLALLCINVSLAVIRAGGDPPADEPLSV